MSNSSTNNKIIPAGAYHSNKFDNINYKLREHFQLANKEIYKVKQYVNELVAIVHNDNKDWSIKKICDYIAGKNDDFEELGFSSKTIYNYLNEENRQLIDTGKYKRQKGDSSLKPSQELEQLQQEKGEMLHNNVKEPSHECFHDNVLEQSSICDEPEIIEEEANEILNDKDVELEEPKNWFARRSPEEMEAINKQKNLEKEAKTKRKLEDNEFIIGNNSDKEKFGIDYWEDKYNNEDSFEDCSKLFKYHITQARYEDARACKYINRMIKIRLDEDPELKINKVIEQVWIRNEDVYGMSRKLIIDNLNTENRERLGKEKIDKLVAKGYKEIDLR